jgi:hypothetical protein
MREVQQRTHHSSDGTAAFHHIINKLDNFPLGRQSEDLRVMVAVEVSDRSKSGRDGEEEVTELVSLEVSTRLAS